jgi:hypothetical protein
VERDSRFSEGKDFNEHVCEAEVKMARGVHAVSPSELKSPPPSPSPAEAT